MNTRAAELMPVAILPVHNALGEGILWDSRRQVLWWTDIQGRRLMPPAACGVRTVEYRP